MAEELDTIKGGRRAALRKLAPILVLAAGVAAILLLPKRGAEGANVDGKVASWPKVTRELTVEAGSPVPTISDFVDGELENIEIASGLDENTNMNTVAEYEVLLRVLGSEVPVILRVEDTKAPIVETKDVRIYDFEGLDAMDFIASVDDATETKAFFTIEPDEEKSGVHKVRLTVWDEAGNCTEASANLEIWVDKEGPVISGVHDITILEGGKVSYRENVGVTDNYDENPKLEIDNSEVNTEKAGDYKIIYTARDAAGNVTEIQAVLHVKKPVPGQIIVTEEMLYAEADKILAKIITADMSQYDKAKAIYNWVHANVGYVHSDNKSDWVRGAWDGLVNHRGDCYMYAQASRALLERAGIKNMIIQNKPGRVHFWNLIDIGEGWYHFDTTRRKDGSLHFYENSESIIAYSNTHEGSHNYDAALYPDIN